MSRRPWTDEEVQRIRDLAAMGHGPILIGRELQRPTNTVAMLMYRKGIVRANKSASPKARKPKPPSRELIAAEVALQRQIRLAKAERAVAKPYKRGNLEW